MTEPSDTRVAGRPIEIMNPSFTTPRSRKSRSVPCLPGGLCRLILCVAASSWTAVCPLAQGTGASVQFSSSLFFAFEDSRLATVTVTRTGETGTAVSVDFRTDSRLATANVDYTPQTSTLAFGANETNKVILIPLFDDALAEGSEPVELTLSNPGAGATLGTIANARLFIQDNEERGTLLDTSFVGAIAETDDVSVIALQPDGKILASGAFARSDSLIPDPLIRLNPDGSRDPSFAVQEGAIDGGIYALAVQPDGRIVIGGEFRNFGTVARGGIARLNANGSLDTSFNPGAGVDGSFAPGVYTIELQENGKLCVGGNFDTFDGVDRRAIVRLNANGSLDPSFDPGNGVESTNPNFRVPWVSQIKLQPDGKLVIAGQFTSVDGLSRGNIARLDTNGFVDASFDPGLSTAGDIASVEAIDLQSDGKVVIGGDFSKVNGVTRNSLARLNADGSLDPSFDTGGGVMDIAEDGSDTPGFITQVIVQNDGRILFGGIFLTLDQINRHGIGRVDPNGALDPTFGPYLGTTYRSQRGYEEIDTAPTLVQQPDGRIIAGATFLAPDGRTIQRITRLLERNEETPSFEFALLRSSAGEENGPKELRIIRRGHSHGTFTLEYSTSGGTATAGADYTPVSSKLSFAPLEVQKSILIPILPDSVLEDNETFNVTLKNPSAGAGLGTLSSFQILIVDSQKPGNLDPSFADVFVPFAQDTTTFPPITAIRIQPDRKILVAGYFTYINNSDRFGMVRFEPNGTIDPTFAPQPPRGDLIVEFPTIGLQPDGRIVGGLNSLNRLNTDGSLDRSFAPDVTKVISMAVTSTGAILVNDEYFDAFTEAYANEVIRFGPEGGFDSSFTSASLNDWANVMTVQPDGKVLLGGYFTELNGTPQNGIARLNANGSVDSTFNPGTGPNGWVETVAVEPGGKILVGGGFTSFNGVARRGLARLNTDGSLDTGFEPNLTFLDSVRITAIAVQPDGQILIGGLFTEVNEIFRDGLARLNGGNNAPKSLRIEATPFAAGKPFGVTLSAEPGSVYQLQASSDLTNWTTVATATATGATLQLQDPAGSTGSKARFYRVLSTTP